MDTFLIKRDVLSSHKEIGPFVAFVGELRLDGEINSNISIYVIVNKTKFEVASKDLLQAVDFCYKIYFALQCDFAVECKHIWTFLQRYIYKHNLNACKQNQVLEKVIVELEKLK